MFVIGDVHGQFPRYKRIIRDTLFKGGRKGIHSSLQLGDMGIMTQRHFDELTNDTNDISDRHLFFRGNHDHPNLSPVHPRYLSDYGYDEDRDLFWMGGGLSIDQEMRVTGWSWWPEEELSFQELHEVLVYFEESKPSIVVTHECPEEVVQYVTEPSMNSLAAKFCPSRTSQALQSMLETHQPDLWIFGHYHKYAEFNHLGTHFVCLNELIGGKTSECIYEIPEIDWGD